MQCTYGYTHVDKINELPYSQTIYLEELFRGDRTKIKSNVTKTIITYLKHLYFSISLCF